MYFRLARIGTGDSLAIGTGIGDIGEMFSEYIPSWRDGSMRRLEFIQVYVDNLYGLVMSSLSCGAPRSRRH
jgi:hypothetical protein